MWLYLLNKEKIKLLKNKNLQSCKVAYYDFVTHSSDEYCFESFNEKLRIIYNLSVVNNKLYWIFCTVLEKNLKKGNFV